MEIVQPIPTRAKIARAWLEHAHSIDRCVALTGFGRFYSNVCIDLRSRFCGDDFFVSYSLNADPGKEMLTTTQVKR